jgi:error-prone DNA polymerase
MGFYAPAQLLRDLRDHGAQVLPVDVNASCWDCTLDSPTGDVRGKRPALRLGLRLVVGLSKTAAEKLEQARAAGPFRSIADVARRAGLSQAILSRLAAADAFSSLQLNRRRALWETLREKRDRRPYPLFEQLSEEDEPAADLPDMPPLEEVLADYRATSLSLKAHPMSFYRAALRRMRISPAAKLSILQNGQFVRVAGLVLLRQRPGTARGITFVTLEDETGIANLIVRQEVWDRYDRVARSCPAWIVFGELQKKDSVIHIVARRLEDLGARLRAASPLREENPVQRIERRFR